MIAFLFSLPTWLVYGFVAVPVLTALGLVVAGSLGCAAADMDAAFAQAKRSPQWGDEAGGVSWDWNPDLELCRQDGRLP